MTVSIEEAKENLEVLLQKVVEGEQVIIVYKNQEFEIKLKKDHEKS
jgi:antitoxin (DNA-binding transcriptional repressor) of toxin-antitoxin stability system